MYCEETNIKYLSCRLILCGVQQFEDQVPYLVVGGYIILLSCLLKKLNLCPIKLVRKLGVNEPITPVRKKPRKFICRSQGIAWSGNDLRRLGLIFNEVCYVFLVFTMQDIIEFYNL